MEMKSTVYASLLLALFLAVLLQTVITGAADSVAPSPAPVAPVGPPPVLTDKDCDDKCKVRCENVQARPDRCKKYCKDCCKYCNCVPSGHYGHKDECACYRDRKNTKGGPKCP